MGESNTGSCRTHTPFSTTASTAHPTEQWVQMVRRTSILLSPMPTLAPSAALDFLTSVSCDAAIPTPTPRPERRRNERRSIVGSACDRPRRKLCTKGDDATCAAWEDFLVSNMARPASELGGLVVLLHVRRQVIATAFFWRHPSGFRPDGIGGNYRGECHDGCGCSPYGGGAGEEAPA